MSAEPTITLYHRVGVFIEGVGAAGPDIGATVPRPQAEAWLSPNPKEWSNN